MKYAVKYIISGRSSTPRFYEVDAESPLAAVRRLKEIAPRCTVFAVYAAVATKEWRA